MGSCVSILKTLILTKSSRLSISQIPACFDCCRFCKIVSRVSLLVIGNLLVRHQKQIQVWVLGFEYSLIPNTRTSMRHILQYLALSRRLIITLLICPLYREDWSEVYFKINIWFFGCNICYNHVQCVIVWRLAHINEYKHVAT